MVRSMKTNANLRIIYWGDALLTVIYVLNCVPSKSVSTDLNFLKPWGYAAYLIHFVF